MTLLPTTFVRYVCATLSTPVTSGIATSAATSSSSSPTSGPPLAKSASSKTARTSSAETTLSAELTRIAATMSASCAR